MFFQPNASREYYFSQLWAHFSSECCAGTITELCMESEIDKLESMTVDELSDEWEIVTNYKRPSITEEA